LANFQSDAQCTIGAWCYVFFQLLTCLLVIVGTFRLCGVFLFKHKRTLRSRYIAVCPTVAFILATAPAIAGEFRYDECSRYCWFIDDYKSKHDCKLQSTWAWVCFYGWMVLFLFILFASTLFVLSKILRMVMDTRSNLKQVVNQTGLSEPRTAQDEGRSSSEPSAHLPSAIERMRSMSYSLRSRATSFFSYDSRVDQPLTHNHDYAHSQRQGQRQSQSQTHRPSHSHMHQHNHGQVRIDPVHPTLGLNITLDNHDSCQDPHEGSHQDSRKDQPNVDQDRLQVAPDNALSSRRASSTFKSKVNLAYIVSLGLDSPTLRNEGILADVLPTSTSIQQQPTIPEVPLEHIDSGAACRARERPFLIAILRQALYPVSISLSGCVQIFVDLMLPSGSERAVTLGYAATVITSIQGLLFFLVFFFDPAVVKTRRHWRKYMVWKYYVEFYFSLGMLQEGNDFEVAFMENCQKQPKRSPVVEWLMKPPSYSWSSQYDYDAMAPEFLTGPPMSALLAAGSTPGLVEQTPRIPTAIRQNSAARRSRPSISPLTGPSPSSRARRDNSASYQSHTFDHLLRESEGEGESSVSAEEPLSNRVMHSNIITFQEKAVDYTHYTNNTHTHPSAGSPFNSSTCPGPEVMSEERIHPMTMTFENPPPSSPTQDPVFVNKTAPPSLSPMSPNHTSETKAASTWPQTSPRALEERPCVVLKASQPGDVLSLPQLARVRTIGGHDGLGRHIVAGVPMVPIRHTLQRNQRSMTRLSLTERIRFSFRGTHRNIGPTIEHYQSAFWWPRCAYVIHILTRLFLVPSSARMAPIPRPPFGTDKIRERRSSIDMIRSGCWNPCGGNRAENAAVQGGGVRRIQQPAPSLLSLPLSTRPASLSSHKEEYVYDQETTSNMDTVESEPKVG
ncbi:hypothetical protein BGZ94_004010, partial [Podila epigama]